MADHKATIDRYFEFWNAGTPDEQRRIGATLFADGINYRAAAGVMQTVDAMIDFRDHVTEHVGSVTFAHRGEPQILHDRARITWEIDAGATEPFAAGTDILEFADDGRIAAVTAFLDRPPAGFSTDA